MEQHTWSYHCLDTITASHCLQVRLAQRLIHAKEITRVWYGLSKQPIWDKVVYTLGGKGGRSALGAQGWHRGEGGSGESRKPSTSCKNVKM